MPYGIRRVGGGVTVLAAVGVSILLAFAIAIVLGLASNPGGPSSSTEPWHVVPAAQQPLTSP